MEGQAHPTGDRVFIRFNGKRPRADPQRKDEEDLTLEGLRVGALEGVVAGAALGP